MGCSWKTYRRAANQKMAGCRVCLCLPFCIIPFCTLCLFLSVCLQSEGRVSFTVTTCEIVFREDGCFLLYSWHPAKHSHLQNCLIWMPWRRTHIRTSITRNRSLGVHTETRGHECTPAHLQTPTHVRTHFKVFFVLFFSPLFCPKDNAWLVFCSCWWWRVVVTVLLSVGLMHYNTALPCCVNSLSLLIENMEASHLARCTSAL